MQYAESIKDYVVLPTQLRSMIFKISRRNLLLENPLLWHCFYCTDTNRKNDRKRVFNWNYPLSDDTSSIVSLNVSSRSKDMHPSRLVPLVTSRSLPVEVSKYVVFDFGSAVFDMAEYDIKTENLSNEFELSSNEQNHSGFALFDMSIEVPNNTIDQPSGEFLPITKTLNPSNLQEKIDITDNIHAVCPSAPELSKETPSIIMPLATCPTSSYSDGDEENNNTDNVSDSELMISHLPIAALFFIVGVITAYMTGYVRKEVNKYLLQRQRNFLDNLEKRVISLLNGSEFEKAARLLKREMPTVVQYRLLLFRTLSWFNSHVIIPFNFI